VDDSGVIWGMIVFLNLLKIFKEKEVKKTIITLVK